MDRMFVLTSQYIDIYIYNIFVYTCIDSNIYIYVYVYKHVFFLKRMPGSEVQPQQITGGIRSIAPVPLQCIDWLPPKLFVHGLGDDQLGTEQRENQLWLTCVLPGLTAW